MPEIFNDLEFEGYRVKEIEEGVLFLREVLNGSSNPEYFKGAVEMLRRIINLPLKMVPFENKSQREQAEFLKAKAFDVFEAKTIRKFVENND